jgi:hypothetical protein
VVGPCLAPGRQCGPSVCSLSDNKQIRQESPVLMLVRNGTVRRRMGFSVHGAPKHKQLACPALLCGHFCDEIGKSNQHPRVRWREPRRRVECLRDLKRAGKIGPSLFWRRAIRNLFVGGTRVWSRPCNIGQTSTCPSLRVLKPPIPEISLKGRGISLDHREFVVDQCILHTKLCAQARHMSPSRQRSRVQWPMRFE